VASASSAADTFTVKVFLQMSHVDWTRKAWTGAAGRAGMAILVDSIMVIDLHPDLAI